MQKTPAACVCMPRYLQMSDLKKKITHHKNNNEKDATNICYEGTFCKYAIQIKPGCFQVGGHLCSKKYEADLIGWFELLQCMTPFCPKPLS